MGEVRYPSWWFAVANGPFADAASVHLLWRPLVVHEKRRFVLLCGAIGADIVMQAGLTWMSLRVKGQMCGLEMQNVAAKQVKVGALERMSIARGHPRASVSLMSGPEYLALTSQMLIAPSKGNEHGEHWP